MPNKVVMYKKNRGKTGLAHQIAVMPGVQRSLDVFINKAFAEAETLKSHHVDTGNSYITKERGRIDRYLVLNDPPRPYVGQNGEKGFEHGKAHIIEYQFLIIHKAMKHPRAKRPPSIPGGG